MSYRIMIVEDEYWTAMDLAVELKDRGVVVTGPFSSVSQAIDVLRQPDPPDAAILDVLLRSASIFPVADLLMQGGIPFVFATGCDEDQLPERFAHVPRFEKPFRTSECVDAVLALAEGRSYDLFDPFSLPSKPAPSDPPEDGADHGRDLHSAMERRRKRRMRRPSTAFTVACER